MEVGQVNIIRGYIVNHGVSLKFPLYFTLV